MPVNTSNWKKKTAEELTDEDVKAMPESEYMNEKQLAFFRRKLSVLRQEILASTGGTGDFLREEPLAVPDPADRATVEEEHTLELDALDRNQAFFEKIEQAIARVDSGDYGFCEETGEPIGVPRLLARPTANLSIEAQERRELRQKMTGS
jgi:DnaK suppressor protein